MSDREYLAQLTSILNNGVFIEGDKDSIADMVKRYANPPLTRAFPVSMRMTIAQYNKLTELMQKINRHLQPIALPESVGYPEYDDH